MVYAIVGDPNMVEIAPSWKEDVEETMRTEVLRGMQVYPDFITEREEVALLNELEPQLRRMRYEFDHWDNVSTISYKLVVDHKIEKYFMCYRVMALIVTKFYNYAGGACRQSMVSVKQNVHNGQPRTL